MKDYSRGERSAAQSGIEPATEARVVALVLGETSDFEEAELNRLVRRWPEIRLLKNRIEAVDALLAETIGSQRKADWKLPVDLRCKLLAAMDVVSSWGLRGDLAVGREVVAEPDDSASALAAPEQVAEEAWARPRVHRGWPLSWGRVAVACTAMGLLAVVICSPALFEDDRYLATSFVKAAEVRTNANPREDDRGTVAPPRLKPVNDPSRGAGWDGMEVGRVQDHLATLRNALGGLPAADSGRSAASFRAGLAVVPDLLDRTPTNSPAGAETPASDPAEVRLLAGDVIDVPAKNWLGDGGEPSPGGQISREANRGGTLSGESGLSWPDLGGERATLGAAAERGLEEVRSRSGRSSHDLLAGNAPGLNHSDNGSSTDYQEAQEVIRTRVGLLNQQLQEMKEVVAERRFESVDQALQSHDYVEAKQDYEAAKDRLKTLKVHATAKRIALQIPKSPITIHEAGTKPKKKGGTIFGGGRYESQAVLQVNPSTIDLDPLAGATGAPFFGALPSRYSMPNEAAVLVQEETLRRVVDELGLAERWHKDRDRAVDDLRDSVSTEWVRGTELIGLKVKRDDAGEAQAIAAALAKTHQVRRESDERYRAARAIDALENEVRAQEDIVEEKRKLLHTIVKTVGIPYIEGTERSGLMGRSEGDILHMIEREEIEKRAEKQQLEAQLKILSSLHGNELGRDAAGLQVQEGDRPGRGAEPQTSRTSLAGAHEDVAQENPLSTFSLHVSDVSFKLARAALERSEWPAAEEVRVEEFVNAFDYGEPAPSMRERVAGVVEQAAHPFLQQRNLIRLSVRTAALGRSEDTPLSLTVLLDNSGSMQRFDRAESVQRAFALLAEQMTEVDHVTLIGFARTPRLLADWMPGNKMGEVRDLIGRMQPEGGTNLEAALQLGLEKAVERRIEGVQSRIVLLTDGAANLGNANPEELARLVEMMRGEGIAFDAGGVGAAGLNDTILEALTRKGNGRYYLLDQPADADEGFARQIAGALRPAAEDVKVQVEFNPRRVARYSLYGFEKHRLTEEAFRDDAVDAAELGAEEAGSALYKVEVLPEGEGAIGAVSVRFRDVASGQMVERRWSIPYDPDVPRLEAARPALQLAAAAVFLGEKLKGSVEGAAVDLRELARMANRLPVLFPANERVGELVQMIGTARSLSN